jgi:hypothetical protein
VQESAADAPSIWDWPFDGARSAGAVAALIAGAVALTGVAVWQYRSNIRRRARP